MTALLTGLVSLLVFGAVILVHELGHFLAARHCGIQVEEFSIGFGPKIFQRRRGSTTYTLRLFPLGGYNLFSPRFIPLSAMNCLMRGSFCHTECTTSSPPK